MRRGHLVLLHGWGLGRSVWQPARAALENSANVHSLDLPGYGAPPDGGQDFVAAALALAASLPEHAVLCAWSLGGLLAMQAALLAPERIGRLILVGSSACFVQRDDWQAAQPPALLDEFSAAVEQNAHTALQRFVALMNQGDTQARRIGREINRDLPALPRPSLAVLQKGLDWLREIDLRAQVAGIRCPTLLIHGAHDPLMPLPAARWLAGQIAQCALDVFPAAAHAPFLNDPQRFARRVDEFLHASHSD